MVKIGDVVEVKIISVDRDRRRIGLSLRQLQPEPWSVVHENYAIGQLVDGTITRLTNFGAFARVDGVIEGLIHISELSNKRIAHPKEVVHEGMTMKLRVIKIDPDKRRMGLSLRRAAEDEYAVVDWAPETDEHEIEEEEAPTAMAVAMADAVEQVEAEQVEEEEEIEVMVVEEVVVVEEAAMVDVPTPPAEPSASAEEEVELQEESESTPEPEGWRRRRKTSRSEDVAAEDVAVAEDRGSGRRASGRRRGD